MNFLFFSQVQIYYHNLNPHNNDFDRIVSDIEKHDEDMIILLEVFKPYFGISLEEARQRFRHMKKYKLHLYEFNIVIFIKAANDDFELINHNQYAVTFKYRNLIYTAGYISKAEEGKKSPDAPAKFKVLIDYLKSVLQQHPQQIIIGDFNVHLHYNADGSIQSIAANAIINNSSWNRISTGHFITLMDKFGFVQKNPSPNENGNYLDVCFSNVSNQINVEKIDRLSEHIMSIKRENHHDHLKFQIVLEN